MVQRATNQGALAAGVILIIIGIMALLINFGILSGESFLIAIGAAFLAAFAIWRNLSLLIPGMILLWLGIATTLVSRDIVDVADDGSIIVSALGLAFLSVYAFMPKRHWWPLIPGGILLLVGIMIFAFTQNIIPISFSEFVNFLWPAALIVIGIWIIIKQFYRR